MKASLINEIYRQFQQGNGEWQQFIKSIKITGIHGWDNQEILFNFPVVALVGENGIGKSTFLKAALCPYKNIDKKNFYPSDMFKNTHWDASAMANATIEYSIRLGNTIRETKWKKTKDWGYTPKQNKPARNVFFLDISRTLPLDATAGYAKIAKIASEEAGKETELDDNNIRNLSYVLGQDYNRARFIGTDVDASREVGLLTSKYGEISQFHQGAGEDSMLDTFMLLQNIPNYSLLVIDEVENSLHPKSQRRFIQYLLDLSRIKKLQIILSTHSPFILEELPDIARIMLIRLADRKNIVYGISSQYALSTIDDEIHPELFVHLEDSESVALFWEIMKYDKDNYPEYCLKISTLPVGSYSVVKTLADISQRDKLPYKCISVVDGDKKDECPNCLCLPGELAPEKQIISDLKQIGWNNLDVRFGTGAGSLFKHLDDITLNMDHHLWTEKIGDYVRKSKDVVWSILIEEWCSQCLSKEIASSFIEEVATALEK